jgi:2-amino-4-hydroxy-6-hydroxymethyldihydropteridine diphosphokinase
MNKEIFLLLGTNQGNKLNNLTTARTSIDKMAGRLINCSRIYKTSPWGKSDQEDFYNQALEVESDLSPIELLDILLKIEIEIGRIRSEKWGPRPIDIDILLYGDQIIGESSLTIPHPRLHERRFALVPLNEIAASFVHPVFRITVKELLQRCNDKLGVERID